MHTSRRLLQSALSSLIVVAAGLSGACASSSTAKTQGAVSSNQPTVRQALDQPKRLSPNGAGFVRVLATGEQAFVAMLQLAANAKIPPHRDASEETIYVLEGGGTMTIDGRDYVVKAGTAVFMPSGAEVSFQNGPQDLVALQVFADPTSASKYDSWRTIRPLAR